MKKKVGIVIGGKSVEHEVSIVTGLQVLDNIDKNKYDAKIIYIDKDSKWFIGKSLHDITNFKNKTFDDKYEVLAGFENSKLILYPHPKNKQGLFSKKQTFEEIDIVFPAVHGTNAEDGSLQGIFEMNNVTYAFGNVLASSIGMDKIIMKKIFEIEKFPIVDYIWFYRSKWEREKNSIIMQAESIGYPLIVKPANLGSSIGISKSSTREELITSVEIAISYGNKIIIEKCISNVREINCAVLGNEDNLIASLCEEPLGWQDFLTYEDKYVNKTKGEDSEKRKIPADISKEKTEEIQKIAMNVFKSIDCSGTARIDFLFDGNNIYVNEINTIPGSIAFYLWEPTGIPFMELITRIIEIAENEQEKKLRNIVSYDIDLLSKMAQGGKKM